MARYVYEIILDGDGEIPNELEEFLVDNLIDGEWREIDNLSMKVSRDDFKGLRCYITAKEAKILDRILYVPMPEEWLWGEDAWDDARMLFYNYVHEVITKEGN